jgi:hypothetical protein
MAQTKEKPLPHTRSALISLLNANQGHPTRLRRRDFQSLTSVNEFSTT